MLVELPDLTISLAAVIGMIPVAGLLLVSSLFWVGLCVRVLPPVDRPSPQRKLDYGTVLALMVHVYWAFTFGPGTVAALWVAAVYGGLYVAVRARWEHRLRNGEEL